MPNEILSQTPETILGLRIDRVQPGGHLELPVITPWCLHRI